MRVDTDFEWEEFGNQVTQEIGSTMKAAILLTCFNRKEKTLSCLKSIYTQSKLEDIALKAYLVDDASKDGTASAVAAEFPEVCILNGDGTLYWNGGMNMAWNAAVKEGFDYYIWINDDVTLSPDAFKIMFESYRLGQVESGADPVIVGCFSWPDSGDYAYGGYHVKISTWGIRTKRTLPEGKIKRCDTFNGNFVLIPNSVVKKVGMLDPQYTHAIGDSDYGYRCMKKNIPMFITPGYIGECERNKVEGLWFSPSITLTERYKKLMLPTGLPPREYFHFYKKNCNSFAGGIALLKIYLRLLFPKLWLRFSRSKSLL